MKMNLFTSAVLFAAAATAEDVKGGSGSAPAAAETAKKSKANYDITRGIVFAAIKSNEGVHLNGLNDLIGETSKLPVADRMKFTVLYASVRQLKKSKTIFGTGAAKNEGLYVTEAAALANKPAATIAGTSKAKQPFVLEKLLEQGATEAEDKWKAIEGNEKEAPIKKAFDTASQVPGSIFRVVHNVEGKEPVTKHSSKIVRAAPAKETKATVKA